MSGNSKISDIREEFICGYTVKIIFSNEQNSQKLKEVISILSDAYFNKLSE